MSPDDAPEPTTDTGAEPQRSLHDDRDVTEVLAFAGALVTACGLEAARRRAGAVVRSKAAATLSGSVVTDVDVALEARIDAALAEQFPADALVGEEGTDRAGTSGRTWVVDPVDGTLNYARHLGPWSVVLSAFEGDVAVLCAVWTQDHLYTAARGRGAHRDGEPLDLSGSDVEEGGIVRAAAEVLPDVAAGGWLVRTAESSAAEVVAIADGRVTGAVRLRGDRRDLHGPALIAAEAGATVTDIGGGPWSAVSPGLVIAHPGAHERLLAVAGVVRARLGAGAKD